ncbi:hypothetical protein B296_00051144, partial [Ensete ventricosum]
LKENLDLIDLRTLHYQKSVAQLYNRKVQPQPIGDGDLVIRKAEVSDPEHSHGKLTLRWEGPYNCCFWMLGQEAFERHLVPELIVGSPHFLEARLEPQEAL